MIQKDILQTLQQHTIAAVAQSNIPTLPIKFVGIAFTPPDSGKWLELIHLPNNPDDQFWNEEEVYRGIWRCILHWPNNGGGAYSPLDLIGSIADYFVKDGLINDIIQITNKAKLTGILEEGKEILYPISVQYQSFSLAN